MSNERMRGRPVGPNGEKVDAIVNEWPYKKYPDGTVKHIPSGIVVIDGDKNVGENRVTGASIASGAVGNEQLDNADDYTVGSLTAKHVGNITYASSYDSLQSAINNTKNGWILVDKEYQIDNPPLTMNGGTRLLGTVRERNGGSGSRIVANGAATNLIDVNGPAAGTPSGIAIKGLQIDGGTQVTNCINLQTDAVSVHIIDNMIYDGEVAVAVGSNGPVTIKDNELNSQSRYGVELTDRGVRGLTIKDNWFEGGTGGFLNCNGLNLRGFIHFIGNRCSYFNVDDNSAFNLQIGNSPDKHFYARVAHNHFFDFTNTQVGLRIQAASGNSECGGPIYIHDNSFNGYDNNDDSQKGQRAIQVDDKVQIKLVVRDNNSREFQGPAVLNLSNTLSTLTAEGNTGQGAYQATGTESDAVAIGSGDSTGDTTVTVSHGLRDAPSASKIDAWLTEASATDYQAYVKEIRNIDSSDFDVVVHIDSLCSTTGETVDLSWEANV